jgi:hypothetical protein
MADNFTIVSQQPITDSTGGGTFVPAMEIRFTTKPSAVPGRVVIPLAQYTPDNVGKVVAQNAALIEQVQAL